MGMKPPYTSRQGQFLAFIHHYTTLRGRPPAEAEMARFFQSYPSDSQLFHFPDSPHTRGFYERAAVLIGTDQLRGFRRWQLRQLNS
jgi:hypothetical protein